MAGSKSQVLAKLWQGKEKSKALLSGSFDFALPTTLPPGGRVSLFKIEYQGEPPKNAPAYQLVYFADNDDEKPAGDNGKGAGDDLPF